MQLPIGRVRSMFIAGLGLGWIAMSLSARAQDPPIDPPVVSKPVTQRTLGIPHHLMEARKLVEDLRGARENVYGGGKRHIEWQPPGCAARTVCASFVTLLLEHTYDITDADFHTWMQHTDPEAEDYHDAIRARNGFARITRITQVRPGDILAVKYKDGSVDTGHVMLVNARPRPIEAARPFVDGTSQYAIEIIDSSRSGHGPTDTRHRSDGSFTGGIGEGVARLYVNREERVVGYAWSTQLKSAYYASPARDLVIGRITRFSEIRFVDP